MVQDKTKDKVMAGKEAETEKEKYKKNKDEVASQVVGGKSKGEVRYCFSCGDEKHLSKDCPKKGDLKCTAHPTSTSHENQACYMWRRSNSLPTALTTRSLSKERPKDPPQPSADGVPPSTSSTQTLFPFTSKVM